MVKWFWWKEQLVNWERKSKNCVFVHIFLNTGSIFIKLIRKLSSAYSTHIVKYISPAKTYIFFRYLSPVASRALLPVSCLAAKVDLYRAKEVLHYVRPSLPCLRFTPSAFFYSRLKTPLFHISFRPVFLVPFGLPSWILHLDRTYWALAFVCFSFIFFYTFGCVC